MDEGKVEEKEGIPEDPFCGGCKNEEYHLFPFEVTDESVGDSKKFKDLVEKADESGKVL
jgi:hypothetical protein